MQISRPGPGFLKSRMAADSPVASTPIPRNTLFACLKYRLWKTRLHTQQIEANVRLIHISQTKIVKKAMAGNPFASLCGTDVVRASGRMKSRRELGNRESFVR
jgi:hypothetical protein